MTSTPPTEDRDWKESLEEFAAGKLNGEDFERLLEIVHKREATAEARGYERGKLEGDEYIKHLQDALNIKHD